LLNIQAAQNLKNVPNFRVFYLGECPPPMVTNPDIISYAHLFPSEGIEMMSVFQTLQLSRFYRESPENSYNLLVSRFLSNSPDFSEYLGNIVKKS
jgi:hypothetical protein